MPDRDRKRVPDHRSDVLKDLSPKVLLPNLGARNISEAERLKRARRLTMNDSRSLYQSKLLDPLHCAQRKSDKSLHRRQGFSVSVRRCVACTSTNKLMTAKKDASF